VNPGGKNLQKKKNEFQKTKIRREKSAAENRGRKKREGYKGGEEKKGLVNGHAKILASKNHPEGTKKPYLKESGGTKSPSGVGLKRKRGFAKKWGCTKKHRGGTRINARGRALLKGVSGREDCAGGFKTGNTDIKRLGTIITGGRLCLRGARRVFSVGVSLCFSREKRVLGGGEGKGRGVPPGAPRHAGGFIKGKGGRNPGKKVGSRKTGPSSTTARKKSSKERIES